MTHKIEAAAVMLHDRICLDTAVITVGIAGHQGRHYLVVYIDAAAKTHKPVPKRYRGFDVQVRRIERL